MSAAEKENIYVRLRKYHLEQFPDKLATANMDSLRESFVELEDEVITMLVGFVNGKIAFTDMTEDLSAFSKKMKSVPTGDKKEDTDRAMFISKIEQLGEMLSLAQVSNFKLRAPQPAKALHGHLRLK